VKSLFYFLISLFLFSCDEKPQEKTSNIIKKKPLSSVAQKHNSYTLVSSMFKKEIANWEEYQHLNTFLIPFKNTSPNEALSNALELRDLVKSVKDSIKPASLETPAFNARINVLYNESLRLADMTFISAIKPTEVNAQVRKILHTFSAVNSKINTIFLQERFENGVEIDGVFIGIDTTKIDTISKKSIHNFKDDIFNEIKAPLKVVNGKVVKTKLKFNKKKLLKIEKL